MSHGDRDTVLCKETSDMCIEETTKELDIEEEKDSKASDAASVDVCHATYGSYSTGIVLQLFES